MYNDALKRSNLKTQLSYEPPNDNRETTNISQKRKRHRNVTWYNPPYSKNVKTNIAHNFLQLIDKHFPPSHKLHKLFNRHTVRVSYSCMDNMKTFIQKHNRRKLSQHDKQNQTRNQTNNEPPTCNCRVCNECPMAGNCLSKSVVYQADVTTDDNNETRSYIGITANRFKERYRNHIKSFQHNKCDRVRNNHVLILKRISKTFQMHLN